jgi:hypothetical protein
MIVKSQGPLGTLLAKLNMSNAVGRRNGDEFSEG